MDSFVDFHPPLKRRLKRLARMGAHVNLAGQKPNARIFVLILSLVLGPLALLVIGLFLLLIAVMTLASFAFLAIWLAVIHKVFALFGSPVGS